MNIKVVTTQKALSLTQITLADYCINPYRGCEFGCTYCYSLENKNVKNLQKLCVKENIDDVLRRQLRFIQPKRVLLGSTTECFQYAELKYRITEKILKTLNEFKIPYTILTKSHLIREYLGIISQNPLNKIYFTVNCEAIKLFEPKSSKLPERLETIRKIQEMGIQLRIHVGPFIPYLSNLAELSKIVPKETKELDIEFYHHKMGNFKKILKIAKNIFGQELASKISLVYENEGSYRAFTHSLKNELIDFKSKFPGISLFYIIPDYNMFYNSNINYEREIKETL